VNTSLSFLDARTGDFPACWDASLRFLRQSWDGQWVGLGFVVDACADFLGLSAAVQTDTSSKLLAAARRVAVQIETECDSGQDQPFNEPSYHNRLHFSDSLVTVTLQASIESAHSGLNDPNWKAAMVLIAVAHDLRHPGRVNSVPAEIEQQSFAALRPHLAACGVPHVWMERIEAVLVRSDFSVVADNHKRVAGLPFTWCTDWATVLLNEADIMASASAEFGPDLSKSLASEWERIQFPAYRSVATPQGRRAFLESIQFSSYSAGVLGATGKVQRQLAVRQPSS
jgi:hypothetical protein